jgi:hypothetical protein
MRSALLLCLCTLPLACRSAQDEAQEPGARPSGSAALRADDSPAGLARARHPAAEVLEEVRFESGGGRVRLAQAGRQWTVVFGPNGRLAAVREPVPVEALPAPVRAAIAEQDGASPTAAEQEILDPHGASRVQWRVRLAGRGATRWLTFAPDGSPREPGP